MIEIDNDITLHKITFNELILQLLHNFHKLYKIIEQQLWLFQRNEMTSLVVIGAVH